MVCQRMPRNSWIKVRNSLRIEVCTTPDTQSGPMMSRNTAIDRCVDVWRESALLTTLPQVAGESPFQGVVTGRLLQGLGPSPPPYLNNGPHPLGGFGQRPGGSNASTPPGSGETGFSAPRTGGNPVPYDGTDSEDPPTSSNNNLGLALGLTFGLGFPLMAAIVVLLIYFFCRAKQPKRSIPEPFDIRLQDKGCQGSVVPRRIVIPQASKELETINEVAETTDMESTVRSQTPLTSKVGHKVEEKVDDKVEGKAEPHITEEKEDSDSVHSQSPPGYATLVTIEDADSHGDEKQPS